MTKPKKIKISYCDGKKCNRKNEALKLYLKSLLNENENDEKIKIKKIKCQKLCNQAPVVCLKKHLCFGVDQVGSLDNFIKIK